MNTFGHAFDLLVGASKIESVKFNHAWYSNWTWITSESSDRAFFEAMEKALNDDCIRKVIKYLDPLHLIYFAQIDKRFKGLISERKRLCLFHLQSDQSIL